MLFPIAHNRNQIESVHSHTPTHSTHIATHTQHSFFFYIYSALLWQQCSVNVVVVVDVTR